MTQACPKHESHLGWVFTHFRRSRFSFGRKDETKLSINSSHPTKVEVVGIRACINFQDQKILDVSLCLFKSLPLMFTLSISFNFYTSPLGSWLHRFKKFTPQNAVKSQGFSGILGSGCRCCLQIASAPGFEKAGAWCLPYILPSFNHKTNRPQVGKYTLFICGVYGVQFETGTVTNPTVKGKEYINVVIEVHGQFQELHHVHACISPNRDENNNCSKPPASLSMYWG